MTKNDGSYGKDGKLKDGECEAITSKNIPLLMEVAGTKEAVDWALCFLGCTRLMVANPCVVLDIDGTILLNVEGGVTKCVVHFSALCQSCKLHNIAIFCITARPEDPENRAYTVRQLEKCKVDPVHLYMREPKVDYVAYKYKARKDITSQTYSILLCIGDQFADLSKEKPPVEIDDSKTYVGQLVDNMQFGIKLPSEFL